MKIVKLDYVNDDWVKSDGIYKDYLDIISEKEKKQKLECQRYNTFLVFHSGKIIMSGLTSEFMEEIFYFFIKTIINSREFIEEKLIK
jgi:hypothetical protein